MEKEQLNTFDKELLLKDLCARLPYGVKMNHIADDEHSPKTLIGVAKDMITLSSSAGYSCVDVEHYKPYLFPLSSMTDEQSKIYHELIGGMFGTSALINFEALEDFFNKNHIDYRGLIPKGLAIDATGKNIY